MATVKIILKTKRKLSNGKYPVTISIAHLKQTTFFIRLDGLYASKTQWSKPLSRFKPSKGKNYKTLNSSLETIEKKIDTIVEELSADNNFTYDRFKNSYLGNNKINKNVEDAYKTRIDSLMKLDKIGTALFYESSLKAVKGFTKGKQISFDEISYKWLCDFEYNKRLKGNTGNTIAVFLRGLRAVHYEYCKANELQHPNAYIKFNLQHLLSPTRKRSLSKEKLKQLIAYEPASEAQKNAKLIFLFSFYARGINLMDMLQLTDENIEDDVLVYQRQKTGKQMRIQLIPEAKQILKQFSNSSKFLFPYIRSGDIPKYRVTDVNRNINRRLQAIGKTFGVGGLTMYYARHTFAELNYKAGVRIEIISQMLGHSDLKTTQTYLRSFSDAEVDEAASRIFDLL